MICVDVILLKIKFTLHILNILNHRIKKMCQSKIIDTYSVNKYQLVIQKIIFIETD